MKLRVTVYLVLCLFVLGLYGIAQSRGWASGGRRAPKPMDTAQLRSSNPGSWTYVYWYHGTRGK